MLCASLISACNQNIAGLRGQNPELTMHIRLETLPTAFRYVDRAQQLLFSPLHAGVIESNEMLQWQPAPFRCVAKSGKNGLQSNINFRLLFVFYSDKPTVEFPAIAIICVYVFFRTCQYLFFKQMEIREWLSSLLTFFFLDQPQASTYSLCLGLWNLQVFSFTWKRRWTF